MIDAIMNVKIISIVALIAAVGPAQAMTACREAPAGKAYWSWREIDGRRCYYEGRTMLPKSELRWGDAQRRVEPECQREPKKESQPCGPREPYYESEPYKQRAPHQLSERAKPSESTKRSERAKTVERTTISERATPTESTMRAERATTTESTKRAERIVDVPSRVMRDGMTNNSNWIDGHGRPIDLMHGEELAGPAGLGGLLVIPPYYASLSAQ
jgi:hypothetical protein